MKIVLSTLFCLIGVSVPLALTQTPGSHPEYTNARSDLRAAQILMRVHDDRDVMNKLKVADVEIDKAVWEIDHAGVLDKMKINEHPPVNMSFDRVGRFQKVRDLLVNARSIVEHKESDAKAAPWREEALKRINTALGLVKQAASDLKINL